MGHDGALLGFASLGKRGSQIRVRFEYVPDGPVSVLALQTQDKERPGAARF